MPNRHSTLPGLFITGTDTGVGKTWLTCAIAACLAAEGLKVGVIKPVATGLTDQFAPDTDAVQLIQSAGWPLTREIMDLANPIAFEAAAAPTVAARAAGRRLEWAEIQQAVSHSINSWKKMGADAILVEGVGGLNCPLAEGSKTVLHLIEMLDWPVLVVARRGLGTLNQTIGTVNALKNGTARMAGVILNHVPGDNADGIPECTAALELSPAVAPVAILHEGHGILEIETLAAKVKPLRWQSRLARPRLNFNEGTI